MKKSTPDRPAPPAAQAGQETIWILGDQLSPEHAALARVRPARRRCSWSSRRRADRSGNTISSSSCSFTAPTRVQLRRELLALARERGPEKTFRPSELAPTNWRPLMPAIREAAAGLVAEHRLRATQRGHEVDLTTAHGPIRLSATGRSL